MLQIGNVDQELSLVVNKLTILRRTIIQRSIFFESDLFLALVSFTYSRYMPLRGNDVMASEIRHQQKLKIFLRNGIKKKFGLIINPTF